MGLLERGVYWKLETLDGGLIREGGLLERGVYWKLETLDGGLIREGAY